MQVIERGQIVESPVAHLGDEDAIPTTGAFTVSLERWLEQRDELRGKPGLGLRLNGTDDFDAAVQDLGEFERIALEFPAFTDGRCYTFARLLRERHGYDGELRAVGDVLRDQLFFMHRCGIDVFEIRQDKDVADALKALRDFSVTYQTAADGRPPVYHQGR